MSSHASSNLSSPSLVSVTTTSSATSSTPLKPRLPRSTKDYSAAFGQLQSQYGWGAPVPTLASSKPRKEQKKRKEEGRESHSAARAGGEATRKESSVTQTAASSLPSKTKDYELAFGALSSRLGFGGGLLATRGQSKPKA
ncbi:hypothetical protein BN946_scf184939.g18 [Trametes cinnabarina]|uniref:Uncharacterized protein n=1 Tax=Pycnoporus cinnabarinus TaxID=5643 RepID=A0A060SHY3_PYCCI|nr:hypothetical protein BN946_scf184939.g18 [Trametes cinnabarina]